VAAPSRLLNVTVNVLFNRYLSDVYTGYKVFTRKAFEGLTLTAKTLPSRWNSPRTLFVTVAVFAALTLRNVIEWRLSRLAWVLGVGASVGVLQVVAYFTLLSVGDNPAMRRWWVAWYVPVSQGPGRAVAFVVTHTGQALTSLGPWAPGPLGPWALALGLVVLGLVALARKGLLGVALSVPLLFVLQVVAAAGRYPFMDPRTSMFFTVVLTVCAGIGLGAVAGWALARWRTAPLALALTAGAGLLVAPAVAEARRMDTPPRPCASRSSTCSPTAGPATSSCRGSRTSSRSPTTGRIVPPSARPGTRPRWSSTWTILTLGRDGLPRADPGRDRHLLPARCRSCPPHLGHHRRRDSPVLDARESIHALGPRRPQPALPDPHRVRRRPGARARLRPVPPREAAR
jgi:hypothetical protein